MNAPYHPIQTAADMMAMVDQSEIAERRKQDMLSAIRRVCDMVGSPPAALKLEVPALRARLAAIRPAAHGSRPRPTPMCAASSRPRWRERGLSSAFPEVPPIDTAWRPLTAAIAGDKRLANGLAAFMNWCACTRVAPALVDDGVLQGFLVWLETSTLHARPRNLVRQIPALWADARAFVPGWPATELTRISFRPVSPNVQWEDLPEVCGQTPKPT